MKKNWKIQTNNNLKYLYPTLFDNIDYFFSFFSKLSYLDIECKAIKYDTLDKVSLTETINSIKSFYSKYHKLEESDVISSFKNGLIKIYKSKSKDMVFGQCLNKEVKLLLGETDVDSILMVHELRHLLNEPNLKTNTWNTLTESLSFVDELLYSYYCDSYIKYQIELSQFSLIYNKIEHIKNIIEIIKERKYYVSSALSISDIMPFLHIFGLSISSFMFLKFLNNKDYLKQIDILNEILKNDRDMLVEDALRIIGIDLTLDDSIDILSDSYAKVYKFLDNKCKVL